MYELVGSVREYETPDGTSYVFVGRGVRTAGKGWLPVYRRLEGFNDALDYAARFEQTIETQRADYAAEMERAGAQIADITIQCAEWRDQYVGVARELFNVQAENSRLRNENEHLKPLAAKHTDAYQRMLDPENAQARLDQLMDHLDERDQQIEELRATTARLLEDKEAALRRIRGLVEQCDDERERVIFTEGRVEALEGELAEWVAKNEAAQRNIGELIDKGYSDGYNTAKEHLQGKLDAKETELLERSKREARAINNAFVNGRNQGANGEQYRKDDIYAQGFKAGEESIRQQMRDLLNVGP